MEYNILSIVVLSIVLVLIITAIFLYNSLIYKRNNINNALSSIDALLKKRYDLIPNLVATVRNYMEYERGLLNQLTELRTKVLSGGLSNEEKNRVNSETIKALKSVFAVAETIQN